MDGSSGSGERPAMRVEVPSGQGVQAGDGGTQANTFIGTYIAEQTVAPAVPAAGQVVAGEVPQRPAAFQPRAGLLEELRAGGPVFRWCAR